MTRRLQVPLLAACWLCIAVVPAAAQPDYAQAITEQRQRLLEAPSAATWNDFGSLLLLTDDEVGAAEAFEQALALEVENPAALYNLGVLKLESNPARSRKLLRSALEISEDGWTHYRLGQVNERLDRERRAIRHYTRAFELNQRLLYPEVNPEIISNRLVTVSLLGVHSQEGPRIEPRFVEIDVLRSLLLQEEGVGASAGAGVNEGAAEPESDGGDEGDAGDG